MHSRWVALLLLLPLLLNLALGSVPARAAVTATLTPGPVSADNGYPTWYADSAGTRLELCLEGPNCLTPPPDPTQPVQFPFNWASEEFYFRADAQLDTVSGGRIRLILANEAAFVGTNVIPGDQITFTRIRITATGLQPNTTYTFTHPYGTESLTTDDLGAIRFTDDQGCLQAPCDFSQPITSRFGPFLHGTLTAPAGFLADPAVPQAVTGSPLGTNLFRAEGPDIGSLTTDQFTLSGKLATDTSGGGTPPPPNSNDTVAPTLLVDPKGGYYSAVQQVRLVPSEPADIFYTLDGSTPTTTSPRYSGPITAAADATTSLRAIAVDRAGNTSAVTAEDYHVTVGREKVGPIDSTNGFPTYYQDSTGRKLELCMNANNALCGLLPTDLPNPSAPEVFPTNYPEEGFWWRGVAVMPAGSVQGGRATLVLATEAAFGTAPAAGDQIVFNRFRVTARGLVPNATYKVTHPYGVNTYVADADGAIKVTEDTGCVASPCDFSRLGWPGGHVGPWLTWDNGSPTPPSGYVGDPNVDHKVTGSPAGTNFFRLEGPDAGGAGQNVAQTDLFQITGKVLGPKVVAEPKGGTYSAPQTVSLTASGLPEDGAIAIYYTTDGTDPTTNSPVYSSQSPISVTASTTLKFLAVNAKGGRSAIGTEVYVIDNPAPTVSAAPRGGFYSTAQQVTLAASTPDAKIYYSTDGSTPSPTTNRVTGPGSIEYTGPIAIATNTTLKVVAVNAAGARSDVLTEIYTIAAGSEATGPVDPTNGFPAWYQDGTGTRLELCLDQTAGLCLAAPPTSGPLAFPDNFPAESFYWNATAQMPAGKLILASEAGFAGGAAKAGDQITFTRIRATLSGLTPGGLYRIVQPFGVDVVQADANGNARLSEDVGCGAAPCNFDAVLGSPVNAFLRWDASSPAAPAGYLGDPNVTHKVTGSPFDTNIFHVEQIDDLGNVIKVIGETDQFAVQGKIAVPRAAAPVATIDSKPADPSTSTTSSFSFSSATAGVTFECSHTLSTAADAYATCTSPKSLGPLANGTYTFKVRAVDGAGTRGAAATYTYTVAAPVDQTQVPTPTAPVQSFQGPSGLALKAPIGDSTVPVTLTWSATDNGTIDHYELQQSTNGGAFAAVATAGTHATLDLKLGTLAPLAVNSYQFRVRAVGKSGTTSDWATGPKFTLVPVDDSSSKPVSSVGGAQVAYKGSWSTGSVAGAYGGAVHTTSASGARALLNKQSFSVSGNVAVIASMGPDRGQVQVDLDGGTPVVVDLYSPTIKPAQVVFALNGIAPGTHTVTLTTLGSKNPASTGTRVDVDAVAVIR